MVALGHRDWISFKPPMQLHGLNDLPEAGAGEAKLSREPPRAPRQEAEGVSLCWMVPQQRPGPFRSMSRQQHSFTPGWITNNGFGFLF